MYHQCLCRGLMLNVWLSLAGTPCRWRCRRPGENNGGSLGASQDPFPGKPFRCLLCHRKCCMSCAVNLSQSAHVSITVQAAILLAAADWKHARQGHRRDPAANPAARGHHWLIQVLLFCMHPTACPCILQRPPSNQAMMTMRKSPQHVLPYHAGAMAPASCA